MPTCRVTKVGRRQHALGLKFLFPKPCTTKAGEEMSHFACLGICHVSSCHGSELPWQHHCHCGRELAAGVHACCTVNLLLFFAFSHSVGRQEPVQ